MRKLNMTDLINKLRNIWDYPVKPFIVRMFVAIGRAATALCRLVKRTSKAFGRTVAKGTLIYFRKRVPRSAAQFSYYIVFSLFPLLICVNWFVGVLHINYDNAMTVLSRFLPQSAVSIITGYLDYIADYQSNAALFLGIFMLMMPASGALRSLQGILSDIYNRGRNTGSLYFVLSFLFSLLFLVVIYLCIVVLFTGNWLLEFVIARFKIGRFILDWNWLRFLVLFLLISFILYVLYRFGPFTGRKPRKLFEGYVLPGMIFSSLALVVVSILFSYFISLSTRYSLVYGSLASIIILMMWLYVCSNVIIIGGIVNRLADETYKKRHGFVKGSALAQNKNRRDLENKC